MSKFKTAIRLLSDNRGTFMASVLQNFFKWFPDKTYLRLLYRFKMGHRLDLKNPKTFTEKLQWLKLYNRKPEYTTMVDKYTVKKYVADIIGEEYIIPTLGVWDAFDDIEFDSLPNQFVLKTTHGGGGGGVVICKDKSVFDKIDAKRKLDSSMRADIYKSLREWPYKDVQKRIIAEEYKEENSATKGVSELRDYKFFCFNGKVKCFKIDYDRFTRHRANYYNRSCEILPFGEEECPPDYKKEIHMPNNIDEMIHLAEQLSNGIPFLRVDFYNVNGKVYFGEITFYPASGCGKFTDSKWDAILGEYINIHNHCCPEKP